MAPEGAIAGEPADQRGSSRGLEEYLQLNRRLTRWCDIQIPEEVLGDMDDETTRQDWAMRVWILSLGKAT